VADGGWQMDGGSGARSRGPAGSIARRWVLRRSRFPGTGSKKVLLRTHELGKVTASKAPRLKVQGPSGREGEIAAEGVVREV
jgi:hypothetical protein